VAQHPRHDAVQREVERVLAQRNALLRQARGGLDRSAAVTLDVWDTKLAAAGEVLAGARDELVDRLRPAVRRAYGDIAGTTEDEIDCRYERSWRGGLAAALAAGRDDDLRRAVTLLGPHRDELDITLAGRSARTQASQGEQRGLALALRLAAHQVVTDAVGTPPVLLLDDVFSELDPDRSDALLVYLPAGQVVLTSASGLPAGADPELVLRIEDGKVLES
jgi:DNA replication and repair protein RecF